MRIDTDCTRVRLDPHRPLQLLGARGARLVGVSGAAWVTVDNDLRDIVLEPGGDFRITTGERVILLSLGGPAWVEVQTPQAAPVPSAWAAATRTLRDWWATPGRASSAAVR